MPRQYLLALASAALLSFAVPLLAPLDAQPTPSAPVAPILPATERKPAEEPKKTYFWLDRATLSQPAQVAPPAPNSSGIANPPANGPRPSPSAMVASAP